MTTESEGTRSGERSPWHPMLGCRPAMLSPRVHQADVTLIEGGETGRNGSMDLIMIVGLGNPGSEYVRHRHNIGFRVVDHLARCHHLAFARHKGAKAHVAEGQLGDHRALLVKPQTFMNQSGKAVARLSRARKVPPERILVVYDDLDLPLGRLRLRPEGGSGGHRGMRSIIEHLGTRGFPRLRLGIDRPPGSMDPAEYVLQPFDKQDADPVDQMVERAAAAVECWQTEGILNAMDRFNQPTPNPADSNPQENSK